MSSLVPPGKPAEVQAGLISIPISILESWPPPNFIDPKTQGPRILVWTVLFAFLALIATVGRLWSRFKLQRNAGLDDWMFICAIFCVVPLVALTNYACLFYFNKHAWDVVESESETLAKLAFWMQLAYILCTGFIKQSLLIFYLRITTRAASRIFHAVVWFMILFQAATTIIWLFLTIFACNPSQAYWARFDPTWQSTHSGEYQCNLAGAWPIIYMSIISIVQDFLCASLPFLVFPQLKISLRQKLALSVVFVFAYGIAATGVVRCRAIHTAYVVTYDLSWHAYNIWAASTVEVLVGVVVSSLPALKYYFRHWFDAPETQPTPLILHTRHAVATILESGQSVARKTHSKARSLSYTLTSISEKEFPQGTSMEMLKTSTVESIIPCNPTAATIMEEEWTSDVADLPKRTPSRQERELRRAGIIKADQWQWDVSELVERTPSRQERELRKNGIIKQDEWQWDVSELQERTPSRQERQLRRDGIIKQDQWQWDVAELQGRSPSFIERQLRAAGIVARDQWQDWDGGEILQTGRSQSFLEQQLLEQGIISPRPETFEGADYFAGFSSDAMPAEQVDGGKMPS